MTSWAIVAIPREDDPVWKLSSEKVPHMTLLFLGEQDGIGDDENMSLYLQHVAETTLTPFYMTVERRGELGPDKADVLFFKKDYVYKSLANTRAYLLDNVAINKAYNSVEQYPEWTPHLTMGYPATPAPPDNDRYNSRIWSVEFDRIALWTGDYDGPTFQLEAPDYSEGDLAMGESVEDVLAHFGVKGMHWGQRKADPDTRSVTIEKSAAARPVSGIKLKERKYRSVNQDTAVTVVTRPGQRVATRGGSNRPADPDAVKAAVQKRIARSSSTDALSTKELQELVTRMNLEQQYSKLTNPNGPTKSTLQKGSDLMKTLVGIKTDVTKIVNDPNVQAGFEDFKKRTRKTRSSKPGSPTAQLAIGQ
jgi:2'-5' RNA ligase